MPKIGWTHSANDVGAFRPDLQPRVDLQSDRLEPSMLTVTQLIWAIVRRALGASRDFEVS
jgi:hypothetical protein